MSANGISHLPNKRQRQEQKLALAATKRANEGKRSTLKKAQMPTLYSSGGKTMLKIANLCKTETHH